MYFKRRRGWELPERAATPEAIYRDRKAIIAELSGAEGRTLMDRRRLLRTLGAGALALAAAPLIGCESAGGGGGTDAGFDAGQTGTDLIVAPPDAIGGGLYPAPRNDRYAVPERALTPESYATTYNNYYEFTTDKTKVHELAQGMVIRPWTIEVTGLVKNPRTYDLDELLGLVDLEERVYRFRCVEAWAMTVPWTGFPLKKLIDLVEPLSSAKFVRMFSSMQPDVMPESSNAYYTWPYYEALRMDEAVNELALLVTGL